MFSAADDDYLQCPAQRQITESVTVYGVPFQAASLSAPGSLGPGPHRPGFKKKMPGCPPCDLPHPPSGPLDRDWSLG
eukprot:761517-Hanusia_phi.AAC.1